MNVERHVSDGAVERGVRLTRLERSVRLQVVPAHAEVDQVDAAHILQSDTEVRRLHLNNRYNFRLRLSLVIRKRHKLIYYM